jgi:ABC-type antimicrobial peptide transport system permease subunit
VVRFVEALESSALGLLAIGYAVSATYVAAATFTSIRRRRREFGTLRALGWPTRRLALLIELEVVLQGVATALVVTAAGVVAGTLASPMATSNFVLAGVLTVCVALGIGLIPAISVYRGSSVRALRGSAPIRHVGGPRSIRVLAARELMVQSRTASIVAVGLLATGVIVFALVTLIAAGFSGSLDTTILGRHVAARAEPYHFVLGAMVLVLAAVANAQLLMLAYEEKRIEIAVLQAVGWPPGAILRFVAWQGLLLATAGAAIGVLISMLIGAALGSSFAPSLLSALAGGTAGFLASAVAVVAVLWHVKRVAPLEVLRGG